MAGGRGSGWGEGSGWRAEWLEGGVVGGEKRWEEGVVVVLGVVVVRLVTVVELNLPLTLSTASVLALSLRRHSTASFCPCLEAR